MSIVQPGKTFKKWILLWEWTRLHLCQVLRFPCVCVCMRVCYSQYVSPCSNVGHQQQAIQCHPLDNKLQSSLCPLQLRALWGISMESEMIIKEVWPLTRPKPWIRLFHLQKHRKQSFSVGKLFSKIPLPKCYYKRSISVTVVVERYWLSRAEHSFFIKTWCTKGSAGKDNSHNLSKCTHLFFSTSTWKISEKFQSSVM